MRCTVGLLAVTSALSASALVDESSAVAPPTILCGVELSPRVSTKNALRHGIVLRVCLAGPASEVSAKAYSRQLPGRDLATLGTVRKGGANAGTVILRVRLDRGYRAALLARRSTRVNAEIKVAGENGLFQSTIARTRLITSR
ncbi:MAG TPA: hypothetical protein VGJ32_12665 [Solirubrobacteraceae bacterium]